MQSENKPCPFCGSINLEENFGGLTTSQLGIDYQSGNIECLDCQAYGPYTKAMGEETDHLMEMTWAAWNNRN